MNSAGKCFRGAVEIEVPGSPEAMGYWYCNFWRVAGRTDQCLRSLQAGRLRIESGAKNVAMSKRSKTGRRQ
jgi:hypothetical protein